MTGLVRQNTKGCIDYVYPEKRKASLNKDITTMKAKQMCIWYVEEGTLRIQT